MKVTQGLMLLLTYKWRSQPRSHLTVKDLQRGTIWINLYDLALARTEGRKQY